MNISWKDNNLLRDNIPFSESIHLLEWVTIPALMDRSSTSDFTKTKRRIRGAEKEKTRKRRDSQKNSRA